jgi:hypothetical protein
MPRATSLTPRADARRGIRLLENLTLNFGQLWLRILEKTVMELK